MGPMPYHVRKMMEKKAEEKKEKDYGKEEKGKDSDDAIFYIVSIYFILDNNLCALFFTSAKTFFPLWYSSAFCYVLSYLGKVASVFMDTVWLLTQDINIYDIVGVPDSDLSSSCHVSH